MLKVEGVADHAPAARIIEEGFEEIFTDYVRRLRASENSLLKESKIREQLRQDASVVLRDTVERLRTPRRSTARVDESLPEAIGETRAQGSVHLNESLRAAFALSQATLGVVAEKLPPSPRSRSEVAAVAEAIHQSITDRFARLSSSYVDYLLRKVHEAHADERWRIGRELNGRVAHTLMVLSHCLEFREDPRAADASRSGVKIDQARILARDALTSLRKTAEELHRVGARGSLQEALSELLRTSVPPRIQTWISVRGDDSMVPPHVREEMLLVLRDAITGTLTYPGVREIKVELLTSSEKVVALVEDSEGASAPGAGNFSREIVLRSMRERVALLGGTLDVYHGTTSARVKIELPLPGAQNSGDEPHSTPNCPVTVLLVDGHDLFRRSVAEMLASEPERIRLVGEAGDEAEALEIARRRRPEVVLLDAETPITGVDSASRKIAEASPASRVVLLTMYENPRLIYGISGTDTYAYLLKSASRIELLSAIDATSKREERVVMSVHRDDLGGARTPLRERLSERQLEILALVARGASNKQIAASLHITEGTVKRHLANIYKQLGVGSRREAARKVIEEGLVSWREPFLNLSLSVGALWTGCLLSLV